MQVCITCVLIKCKSKQPHSQAQPLRVMKSWVDPEWGWQLDSTELNFTHKVSKTKTKNDCRTDSEKVCPLSHPCHQLAFIVLCTIGREGVFFFFALGTGLPGYVFWFVSAGKWLACQSMDNQIMIYGVHTNFRLNRKKNFRGHMVRYAATVVQDSGIIP